MANFAPILKRLGILAGIVVLICLLPLQTLALNPATPHDGDPDGTYKMRLRFLEGTGTTTENDANYHVCSDPAYSKANFTELDATFGGATGTPSWNSSVSTEIPSVFIDASKSQYIQMLDNSSSCTTGNDPLDHTGTDYMYLSAWVKPKSALTCADIGITQTIISKWDAPAGQCSYILYIEAVDTVPAGACDDADMFWRARAAFNDSGATFSCASPCTLAKSPVNLPVDGWYHIGLFFGPALVPSLAFITVGGKQGNTNAAAAACFGGTDIPDGFTIQNSTADLYIGVDGGGTYGDFNGNVGGVQLHVADHTNISRNYTLNHLNNQLASTGYPSYNGGEDPYLTFGYRTYMPNSSPTPGETGAQVESTTKRYSQSVKFDGINDYVTYPNSLVFNEPARTGMSNFMVEAWIYKSADDGQEGTIAAKWLYNNDAGCTDDTTNSAFRLFIDTAGKLNFSVYNDAGSKFTATSSTTISAGKWYHVAGVLTATTAPQYLTADSVYTFIDGLPDGTPTTFTPATGVRIPNPRDTMYLGATAAGGTTCTGAGKGTAKHFFGGYIDEFRVNVTLGGSYIESFNPGVTINEVNYQLEHFMLGPWDEVELLVFPDLGHSLNLDGYTLEVCSEIAGGKLFVFDDACTNCRSKVVDPGDIVTLYLDRTGAVSIVDTSCDGAATTCVWHSINSAGGGSGTWLKGGVFDDVSDGMILYNRAAPNTAAKRYAAAIDGMIYGAAASGDCAGVLSNHVRGIWEKNEFVVNGATNDDTRTLCLDVDGSNEYGSGSWTECGESMGLLNSTGTTSIQLLGFGGSLESNYTKLYWSTGVEKNVLGFNILRASNPLDPYVVVNKDLIPAEGGFGIGANYEFDDLDTNTPHYYKLEEIELDGATAVYGPIYTGSSTTSYLGPSGTHPDVSNIISTPEGSSSLEYTTGGGCGGIAARTTTSAGTTLWLAMIAIIYLTTRSYWMLKPLAAKW